MRKHLFILFMILCAMVSYGCDTPSETPSLAPPKTNEKADKPTMPDSCGPEIRALGEHAVVELKGEGTFDIVVITDPLCWHCRLGHKLLSDSPEKFRSVKLLFFPRKSFIGSDMAAWILEDAAGTDRLKDMVDFAYDGLKQPKTKDLNEARAIILIQFTQAFPHLLNGTVITDLYARLEANHAAHVVEGAMFANAAKLPGTPILIAGKNMVVGYGPDKWIEALDKKELCD